MNSQIKNYLRQKIANDDLKKKLENLKQENDGLKKISKNYYELKEYFDILKAKLLLSKTHEQ